MKELTNVDCSEGVVELDAQHKESRGKHHLKERIGEEGTNRIDPLFPYILVLLSTPAPQKLDMRVARGKGMIPHI